ncbi:hypothetical protein P8C59_008110 [Phyllachora maydis]|uniref:Uncharacterized protein n=1 Tax=Phyllachora maydis TaxID=1825666 RepID=A0AAD9IB51_9PEZI|nr:hypothetical protein P8C59_008110 [Phyllachora maydis]
MVVVAVAATASLPVPDLGTVVGAAMRRRFIWLFDAASSISLSLVSRFVPAGPLAMGRGVSGGVVTGTPVTLPDFAAAMLGTWPAMSGGFEITHVAADACVITDDVEFDRAGDVGC